MKEELRSLYCCRSAREAATALANWLWEAQESGLSPFQRIAATQRKWRLEVLNHWRYPLTSYTVHPGQDGAAAIRLLLAMAPDVLFFRGHFAYIKNPLATEASAYGYGSDHAILRGRYGASLTAANRIQVLGDGLLVEAFDWGSIGDIYDRLRLVDDLNLDTVAVAQERAAAELRREAIASLSGEIAVPTNCGQELYDVVTITDASAGLQAAARRVVGLALHYGAAGRAVYEQGLLLGAV